MGTVFRTNASNERKYTNVHPVHGGLRPKTRPSVGRGVFVWCQAHAPFLHHTGTAVIVVVLLACSNPIQLHCFFINFANERTNESSQAKRTFNLTTHQTRRTTTTTITSTAHTHMPTDDERRDERSTAGGWRYDAAAVHTTRVRVDDAFPQTDRSLTRLPSFIKPLTWLE